MSGVFWFFFCFFAFFFCKRHDATTESCYILYLLSGNTNEFYMSIMIIFWYCFCFKMQVFVVPISIFDYLWNAFVISTEQNPCFYILKKNKIIVSFKYMRLSKRIKKKNMMYTKWLNKETTNITVTILHLLLEQWINNFLIFW